MKKLDLKKAHKELYTATSKIKEVEPGKATFLALHARGAPGGPAYQDAIAALLWRSGGQESGVDGRRL